MEKTLLTTPIFTGHVAEQGNDQYPSLYICSRLILQLLNIFLLLESCHRACACAKAGLPPPDLSPFTFQLPPSEFRPSLCICVNVYFCVFVYLCSFASSTPENPLVYKPSYHFAKLSVIAIVGRMTLRINKNGGEKHKAYAVKRGWK